MLSFMRRWSAPFEKYETVATSSVNTPLLAHDDDDGDDDDDDDGDCENVEPSCTAAEDKDDDETDGDDDDDDDDEVFERGWPARAKTHWLTHYNLANSVLFSAS